MGFVKDISYEEGRCLIALPLIVVITKDTMDTIYLK